MPTEIPPRAAKAKHGISTFHEIMDSHELRFRLKHTDGTAYIRTEAATSSGWQEAHFHERVIETYIVQSEWMGFAELVDGQLALRIIEADGIVSTRPQVIHNVYLPPGATIHTVKHGTACGGDRKTDATTQAFELVTKALHTDVQVRAAAMHSPKATYSAEYRHFDNLIWQVPAWATAIFALSIQSVLEMIGRPDLQASLWQWMAVLVLFSAACIACFSLVLARFRIHQRAFKGFARTPFWKSASTWTQFLLALEVMALCGMALVFFGMIIEWAIVLSVAGSLILFAGTELAVHRGKPARPS